MTHRLRTTGIVMFSYSKSNSKLNLFKNQAYLIEYVMALKLLKDLLNLKYSMKKASLDWQKCQLLRLPPTKMMGVLGACFKRDKAGDREKLLHALPAARALDNCEHIRVDCPIQTYQSRLVFPTFLIYRKTSQTLWVWQLKGATSAPQQNHQDDHRGAYSNHPGRGLVSVTFTDTEAIWITFPAQIHPSQVSAGVDGWPSLYQFSNSKQQVPLHKAAGAWSVHFICKNQCLFFLELLSVPLWERRTHRLHTERETHKVGLNVNTQATMILFTN